MTAWTQVDIEARTAILMFERALMAIDDAPLAGWLQKSVSPTLRERAEKRFASEGDSASGPWAQLAPATVAARGSAHPINHVTGELENYITTANGSVHSIGAGMALEFPNDTGEGGELGIKVNTAQKGNNHGAPARPVLAVDTEDLQLILTSFTFYLAGVLATGVPA